MNFGVVVFPQVEELDFVGPCEMIAMWKQIARGPESCRVVAERNEPVACAKWLSIDPRVSFEENPALDFMLVPGGRGTRAGVPNPRMLEFVATLARSCEAILSVCAGSFVLHAAGNAQFAADYYLSGDCPCRLEGPVAAFGTLGAIVVHVLSGCRPSGAQPAARPGVA
jgi:putative intracellular protease/amidase